MVSLLLGTHRAPGPGKDWGRLQRCVQKRGPKAVLLCSDSAQRPRIWVPTLADLGQDKSLYLFGL